MGVMKPIRAPEASRKTRATPSASATGSSGPKASATLARTSSPLTKSDGRQRPSSLHSGPSPVVGMSSMKRTSSPSRSAKRTKSADLVVVDAADDDGVDLERLEPFPPGRLEAGEDPLEARAPGDRLEPLPPQRIEADRDAP